MYIYNKEDIIYMWQYLRLDFLYNRVTRDISLASEWVGSFFTEDKTDTGYTVIDTYGRDRYITYEELWEL